MEQQIVTIVVEGGPCSGKTSGMPRIKEHFEKLGWFVLVSVEVPTRLAHELSYYPNRNVGVEEFQQVVLEEVIDQETRAHQRAVQFGAPKTLILCDRGRFGGAGYQDPEEFFAMAKKEYGLYRRDLYRYDGCIFLQSLAVDKPELYLEHMKNNSARREVSVERGVRQNQASLDASVGISRMQIIDNSTSFDEKISRAIKAIEHFLGDEEYERKFASPDNVTLGVAEARAIFEGNGVYAVPAFISQAYLVLHPADREQGMRVKRIRSLQLGSEDEPDTCYLTLKGPKLEGGAAEIETRITGGDYLSYLSQESDNSRHIIAKMRIYFVYGDRYWELDVFSNPEGQRFILECEHLPGEDVSKIIPPPYFGPLEDVTDDPKFANQQIAEKVE